MLNDYFSSALNKSFSSALNNSYWSTLISSFSCRLNESYQSTLTSSFSSTLDESYSSTLKHSMHHTQMSLANPTDAPLLNGHGILHLRRATACDDSLWSSLQYSQWASWWIFHQSKSSAFFNPNIFCPAILAVNVYQWGGNEGLKMETREN